MSEEIVPRKKGFATKYDPAVWDKAQVLVEEHPELSMSAIARQLDMPITTLESKAIRSGWFNKRDLAKAKKADYNLKRVTRELATQLNDLHGHSMALIEALQYSHRIKIVRDDDGQIHYRNFDDYPDRPVNWDTLSEEEKESFRRHISPVRLKQFTDQLQLAMSNQKETMEFVAKMTKASLPKVDPELLDISERVSQEEILDAPSIFKTFTPSDKSELDKLREELEGKKDE